MREARAFWLSLGLGLAGVVGFLILPWVIAVQLGVRAVVLPAPADVASTARDLLTGGTLLHAAAISLARVNAGFALAIVTALPLGILLGRSPRLFGALEPIIDSFRYVIPFAWIPLAILWFGTHESGKLFIIWYAGFFVLLLQTIGGARSVDPDLIKAARALGAGEFDILTKVVLPAAVPQVVLGLRIAFATCWVSILAAELVAARAGLGYLIMDARELLQTDVVIVGMAVIGCVGALYNWLFGLLQRRLTRHQPLAAGA